MRFINYFILIFIFCLFNLSGFSQANIPYLKLVGKYEFDSSGMNIQFTLKKGRLFLITPGAPLQQMELINKNRYRSKNIKGDLFHFIKKEQDVIELISTNAQGTMRAKKISDKIEDYSEAMDSLLMLRRSTAHFKFWYSKTDMNSIDSLAASLEKSYNKILSDFKIKTLPSTRVKIYPDIKAFHLSINSPDAPAEVLATAYGKGEFRMVSPTKWGSENNMLMQYISHEFIHCVHLNIDYSPNNPRWLWEGIAMYKSGWFINPGEFDIIKNKNFPALSELNNGMEYALGYVIVEAIKDLWDFNAVLNLIKIRAIRRKHSVLVKRNLKKPFSIIYIGSI